jgi:SAM-dependent methyltransferase
MDFGYSLGVLHHIPDTARALSSCVKKLRPDAPFLAYLYYRFDNRSRWFRVLWAVSDSIRRTVSKLPLDARHFITDFIAAGVYFPMARFAKLLRKCGVDTSSVPLSAYADLGFYTMRTDSLDRFGTKLEQRFTRAEIQKLMEDAGLEKIVFRDSVPYWCAVGAKSR